MENRSTTSSPRLIDHSVNSTIRLDSLVDEIQDIHVIIIYLWIIPYTFGIILYLQSFIFGYLAHYQVASSMPPMPPTPCPLVTTSIGSGVPFTSLYPYPLGTDHKLRGGGSTNKLFAPPPPHTLQLGNRSWCGHPKWDLMPG